jgi:hypothetical protein
VIWWAIHSAAANDLRGTLRNFGLKVGVVGTAKFEARIFELVADIRIWRRSPSRCWSPAGCCASSLACCIVDCSLSCVRTRSAAAS